MLAFLKRYLDPKWHRKKRIGERLSIFLTQAANLLLRRLIENREQPLASWELSEVLTTTVCSLACPEHQEAERRGSDE